MLSCGACSARVFFVCSCPHVFETPQPQYVLGSVWPLWVCGCSLRCSLLASKHLKQPQEHSLVEP